MRPTEARVIALIGTSGSGKSSIKQLIQKEYGAEVAPKYTTRASRGTAEDAADFIFCQRDAMPTKRILTFDSYGDLFGIQLDDIEQSLQRGHHHVLGVGDCSTVRSLSALYPNRLICIFIYCAIDVLHSRIISDASGSRSSRWTRIVEQIEETYPVLSCVQFVVDNSGSFAATRSQVDAIMRKML
jgi:guanylate kinase